MPGLVRRREAEVALLLLTARALKGCNIAVM